MTKKNWIIVSVLILSILVFFEVYIRYDHPDFFNEIIENSKSDQNLMLTIGGFKSFEYEFNKNDLSKDTLDFAIKVIGGDKNLIYEGKSVKDSSEKWIVVKQKMLIK